MGRDFYTCDYCKENINDVEICPIEFDNIEDLGVCYDCREEIIPKLTPSITKNPSLTFFLKNIVTNQIFIFKTWGQMMEYITNSKLMEDGINFKVGYSEREPSFFEQNLKITYSIINPDTAGGMTVEEVQLVCSTLARGHSIYSDSMYIGFRYFKNKQNEYNPCIALRINKTESNNFNFDLVMNTINKFKAENNLENRPMLIATSKIDTGYSTTELKIFCFPETCISWCKNLKKLKAKKKNYPNSYDMIWTASGDFIDELLKIEMKELKTIQERIQERISGLQRQKRGLENQPQ